MYGDTPIHMRILKDRDLTKGQIEEFLNPLYDEERGGMFDVSRMKDIDKACDRVWKAVECGEKICLYADYDADGVPAATIAYEFFKKIGCADRAVVLIPHRHKDGFGLHSHLIDEMKKQEVSLLITMDLGISNVEQVDHANSLGIDVIVTDHHMPHEELPKAYAILNPKQPDCRYGEKMLCGSGVMYKFIHRLTVQARQKKYDIHAGWEKWLLDMVGLATISDMVPLVGENRLFAVYGLKVLQKGRRIGMKSLLSELKIYSKDIQEDDIGFSISPCINAASRMSHAMDAFQLLSSEDSLIAVKQARHLVTLNKSRKEKAQFLIKSAEQKLSSIDIDSKKVIVLGDADWSPTMVGPVASSMVRKFQRPVFVYGCEDGDVFRGSCRSVPGFSLVEIMKYVTQGFFEEFGGHALSGGFAFTKDKLDVFESEIEKAFITWRDMQQSEVVQDDVSNEIYTISHDLITESFVQNLNMLRPFGIGNEKPLFKITGISLKEVKKFGKTKEHVEFLIENFVDSFGEVKKPTPDFLQDTYKYSVGSRPRTTPIRYISFFAEDGFHNALVGVPMDVYGYIEESFFLGKREIRIRVEKLESKV